MRFVIDRTYVVYDVGDIQDFATPEDFDKAIGCSNYDDVREVEQELGLRYIIEKILELGTQEAVIVDDGPGVYAVHELSAVTP